MSWCTHGPSASGDFTRRVVVLSDKKSLWRRTIFQTMTSGKDSQPYDTTKSNGHSRLSPDRPQCRSAAGVGCVHAAIAARAARARSGQVNPKRERVKKRWKQAPRRRRGPLLSPPFPGIGHSRCRRRRVSPHIGKQVSNLFPALDAVLCGNKLAGTLPQRRWAWRNRLISW